MRVPGIPRLPRNSTPHAGSSSAGGLSALSSAVGNWGWEFRLVTGAKRRPDLPASSREHADALVDCQPGFRARVDGEQLLDVPLVLTVSPSDVDSRFSGEWQPEVRVQHTAIVDEQVLTQSRSTHAVYRQSRRANQRVSRTALGENGGDAFEKRHRSAGSFESDLSRPTVRARASSRRASAWHAP